MMSPEMAILVPAFLAGLLIFATHIPLGQEVLRRKIVFIDLALAQIASLGIMMPILFGRDDLLHTSPWAVQAFAIGFALLGAFLIERLRAMFKDNQEGLVGTIYIVSFSAAILIGSTNLHGAEHLMAVIDGQLLWADYQAVSVLGLIAVLFYALLWWKPEILTSKAFYYIMAAVVVMSVQVVGVYLVFASLIIPALFNSKLNWPRWALIGVSSLALAGGLAYSLVSDLPTSPLIICLLLVIFIWMMLIKWIYRPVK